MSERQSRLSLAKKQLKEERDKLGGPVAGGKFEKGIVLLYRASGRSRQ